MTIQTNESVLIGEKEIEEHLRTMAADGDKVAIEATIFADTWPRPTVRKREIALFTGYDFSLLDFIMLQTQMEGPTVHTVEDDEPVYAKWTLAHWLYIFTTTPPSFKELEEEPVTAIPDAWFIRQGDDRERKCCPYEVMLHRMAELGDTAARNMVLCAVYWPHSTVTLDEFERFSHGTVGREDCFAWVELAYGKDAAAEDTTFDKWQVALWIYKLIQNWPSLLGIPLIKEAVELEEDDSASFSIVAEMDWEMTRTVYHWLYDANCQDEEVHIDEAMLARGYEKLAARAGMTVEEYKAIPKPAPPADEYDMDERAALMDAHGMFADADLSTLQPADLIGLEADEEDLDPWFLKLFVERAVRSLPWPVDKQPFLWSK